MSAEGQAGISDDATYVERIEVLPDGAAEQDGLLRDDCNPTPKVFKADGTDVDAINDDLASSQLCESEEAQSKGRLAATSPTDQTDLLLGLDVERDAVDDRRKLRVVLDDEVFNVDLDRGFKCNVRSMRETPRRRDETHQVL